MNTDEMKIFAELLGSKIVEGLVDRLPAAIAAGIAAADASRASTEEARVRESITALRLQTETSRKLAATAENDELARQRRDAKAAVEKEAMLEQARAIRGTRERIIAEAAAVGMPLDLALLPALPAAVIEDEIGTNN